LLLLGSQEMLHYLQLQVCRASSADFHARRCFWRGVVAGKYSTQYSERACRSSWSGHEGPPSPSSVLLPHPYPSPIEMASTGILCVLTSFNGLPALAKSHCQSIQYGRPSQRIPRAWQVKLRDKQWNQQHVRHPANMMGWHDPGRNGVLRTGVRRTTGTTTTEHRK